MIETFYRCDLCRAKNDEDSEFKNQVILVGQAGTERVWKVDTNC